MFRRRQTVQTRPDGCGYLVLTALVTSLFLVLNSALVWRFYPALSAVGPEFLRHNRVAQMALFLGPVILIFAEWWIVDFVVETLSPRRPKR